MEYKLNGSDIVVSLQDVHIDANVGESAKLEVQTAVNFIKSGQAEVNAVADARTAEFNANAAAKIAIVNAGAESASQSAGSASDSANAAQGYANNAEDSATAAAASAESINFAKSTNTDLETDGEPSDDYVPTQKAVKTYVDDGLSAKVDASSLATVAFTGDYDDLSDKPTLGTMAAESASNYTKTANLASVALSGSYNDLTNKPTIPTVNNATLTISKNGSSVGTFTANASSAKTINITVPTSASDVGALPSTTKYGAKMTLSLDNLTYKITAQLKDQNGSNLGASSFVDLPLENFATHSELSSAVSGLASENWVLAQGYTTNVGTVTSVNNTSPDSAGNVTLSIPPAQVNSDWNAVSGVAEILNKPTIPTVNNATITFTQGGTTKGTITLNQSSNQTIAFDAGGGGGTVDQTYNSTSSNAQSGIAIAGAGFLTSSALSGYATEAWVGNQGYQLASNIATTLTSTLTDSQYPSAKLFYDTCGDIETLINAL